MSSTNIIPIPLKVSFGPAYSEACEPYGMPYAEFSKQEKLCHIADWVTEEGIREANYRHHTYLNSQSKTAPAGSGHGGAVHGSRSTTASRRAGALPQAFGYVHSDLDKSFKVVESTSSATGNSGFIGAQRNGQQKQRYGTPAYNSNSTRGGERHGSGQRGGGDRRKRYGDSENLDGSAGASSGPGGSSIGYGAERSYHQSTTSPYSSGRRGRENFSGRGGQGGAGRGGYYHNGGNVNTILQPSIPIETDWDILQEFDLGKMGKMVMSQGSNLPVPETVATYGRLGAYNQVFDHVTTKSNLQLAKSPRSLKVNTSTSSDPIILDYARKFIGKKDHKGDNCQDISKEGGEKENKQNSRTRPIVFATDKILSQLMASTRSVFSWDIVVTRVDQNIVFFDRRGNTFDLVTVNENALDAQAPPPVPMDASCDLNNIDTKTGEHPSLEATYINANYSQQVVNHTKVKKMDNESPFFKCSEKEVPSSASIYKRWVFSGRKHSEIELFARTELDAFSKDGMITIHALNNVPAVVGGSAAAATVAAVAAANSAAQIASTAATASAVAQQAAKEAEMQASSRPTTAVTQAASEKRAAAILAQSLAKKAMQAASVAASAAAGVQQQQQQQQQKQQSRWNQPVASQGIDWHQKLDTQRAAVAAHEIRNNSCKIARWTLESLLAEAKWMHIGFVGRASTRDVLNHVIMGSTMYRPQEIASQTNIVLPNVWAILASFVEAALAQPPGTYVLVKDPNHPLVRLYAVGKSKLLAHEELSNISSTF